MGEGVLRQPKHLEIDSALDRLNGEISKIEDFLDSLANSEKPKDVRTAEGKCTPSWNTVYSSLTERIREMTDRLNKAQATLREMLF